MCFQNVVIIAEKENEDKQNLTKANRKEGMKNSKDGKKDQTLKQPKQNGMTSFLPVSGVDIELSNESKQKLRKRSDYKIRLKYSENNGKT